MLSGRQAATQGLVRGVRKETLTITPCCTLSRQPGPSGWGVAALDTPAEGLLSPCSPREPRLAATGLPEGTKPQAAPLCSSPSGPRAFPWGRVATPAVVPGAMQGCSFAPTSKSVPVRAGALRCFLLLRLFSPEGSCGWRRCCFGRLGYFSVKIKEMDPLAQGRGRRSNSCFFIFTFGASIPAPCSWPRSSWLQTPAQSQAGARAGFPPFEPLPSAPPGHGSFSLLLFGHRGSALTG